MTESQVAVDLTASFGTLRRAAFPDRLEAAALAGFAAIGLTVTEYAALLGQGWTDADILRILESFGLRIGEAELIVGFWASPGPANVPERPGLVYADPANEALILRMADALGLPCVQAVGTFDDRSVGPEVADAFGALCDRAAPHGLRVALEFVPYTSIPDLSVASGVVSAAGRANGGLCIDSWHFFRGGGSVADLANVDPASTFMIQVNDGPLIPTDENRMNDAVSNRRCPGEGDFDLMGFLGGLWAAGVNVPLSVEVFSTELERSPTREAARRAASGTRAVVLAAHLARVAARSSHPLTATK
ncbi:MAG: TIM barrel protein [Actinobacteria bacterium]|uniref:Unannotated protein n=1 Tax=freshwater metagenome TaxID=449393 RepID=A0A6J7KBC9_9ZZZZ|nr:TIM barrel protein [Actinomycetota bacterium]